MKIVYMGTPVFAVAPLKALHQSSHQTMAVITGEDKPSGRGRKLSPTPVKVCATELQLPTLTPGSLKDPELLDRLREYQADLFVVIAFRILPPELFALPRLGSVNIHASLLPGYRGAAPIQRALMNGDSETGLSAFFLEKRVDTGAIINQVTLPIAPADTYSSLVNSMSEASCSFLLETLELLESGKAKAISQDDTEATPAPKIKPAELQIDWNRPAVEIVNQIRGLSETPGAYTIHRGKRLKALAAKLIDSPPAHLHPGEVHLGANTVCVGTGQGVLQLLIMKIEGKKTMDSQDMINGHLLNSGETLGAQL